MVRLRLYETLTLLPANALESSYTHLLRMLVSEFTLTENPANTTTSLLRAMCHADDSIILGTWLQETDHRSIEDQVSVHFFFICYFFLNNNLHSTITLSLTRTFIFVLSYFYPTQKKTHTPTNHLRLIFMNCIFNLFLFYFCKYIIF